MRIITTIILLFLSACSGLPADCDLPVKVNGGIELGTGTNRTVLKRGWDKEGRLALWIFETTPNGEKVTKHLIKKGSPADTQQFAPGGMKD